MDLGQSTQTRDIKWVSGKEAVNILSKVSRASGELSQLPGLQMLSLCCVSPGFSTRTHRAQPVCGRTGKQVTLCQISPYLKRKLTPPPIPPGLFSDTYLSILKHSGHNVPKKQTVYKVGVKKPECLQGIL